MDAAKQIIRLSHTVIYLCNQDKKDYKKIQELLKEAAYLAEVEAHL